MACVEDETFSWALSNTRAELRQIEDYTRPIILFLFIACVKAY